MQPSVRRSSRCRIKTKHKRYLLPLGNNCSVQRRPPCRYNATAYHCGKYARFAGAEPVAGFQLPPSAVMVWCCMRTHLTTTHTMQRCMNSSVPPAHHTSLTGAFLSLFYFLPSARHRRKTRRVETCVSRHGSTTAVPLLPYPHFPHSYSCAYCQGTFSRWR